MEQLGFNLPLLLAQVINFLVVLLALRLFLYKPVLAMLDRRAQRVREGLEAAESSKEQAAQADQEVARQLEEARRQGQALVAQTQEAAARIQEEAREQARRELVDALEAAVKRRDRFSLIEVMLPRGVTSKTLARFVAGFKAAREKAAAKQA